MTDYRIPRTTDKAPPIIARSNSQPDIAAIGKFLGGIGTLLAGIGTLLLGVSSLPALINYLKSSRAPTEYAPSSGFVITNASQPSEIQHVNNSQPDKDQNIPSKEREIFHPPIPVPAAQNSQVAYVHESVHRGIFPIFPIFRR